MPATTDAVADLFHAWFTGTVLLVTSRRGEADGAALVFAVFRRQQQQRFLPGLHKLGLQGLPPAVAAARYHYLSNSIGGVGVEYVEEGPHKAWIRYPPPRWVWPGAALCGIPSAVNSAMLRGWHAQNGVSLNEPRLGFVCTGQTVDGDPGLEGYYLLHDAPLAPEQRLRFARGETMPPFDPATAPRLPDAAWPAERIARAKLGYAVEYARSVCDAAVGGFGQAEGEALLAFAARLVGMQCGASLAPDVLPAIARALRMELRVDADGWALDPAPLTRGMCHPAAMRAGFAALVEGALRTADRKAGIAISGDAAWRVTRPA